jgi:hypothetical protein
MEMRHEIGEDICKLIAIAEIREKEEKSEASLFLSKTPNSKRTPTKSISSKRTGASLSFFLCLSSSSFEALGKFSYKFLVKKF